MQNIKSLSILVPCYNHEKYIEDAIKSIWQQNIDDIELIVIDDGSKDKSFETLQKLQKLSPIDMHIEKQNNMGITKTLNKALKIAKGQYISILASDDKYEQNSLLPLLKTMQNNNNLKVIYANGHGFNIDGLTSKVHTNYTANLLKKSSAEIYQEILVSVPRPLLTQCAMFEKEMLQNIGGWDENVKLDDWPLNIKIFKYLTNNNFTHMFLDHDVVLYRDHDEQIHKQRDTNFDMIIEVINKYTPKKYKPKFLSLEMRHRAKDLLRDGKIQQANNILFKAIKIDKSFDNIFKSLRLMIKYNIKNFFIKR